MRGCLLGLLLVAWGMALAASDFADAQDTKKKEQPKKKVNPAFVDAKEAGPDFLIQGEYEGAYQNKKALGVQVVARGDGKFTVYFLTGGLPGKGWDGKTRVEAAGVTDDKGAVQVVVKGWAGFIADGVLQGGDSKEGPITLKRVVRESPTLGMKATNGVVVLFDGTSTDNWLRGKLAEGKYLDTKKTGNIISKRAFRDFTLHLEFRTPFMPYSTGQGRGNSGVYLQDRYELQVLDSFGLKGVNNECGGFYQQADPQVNMCLPPLSWQTYDIDFKAARFDSSGNKTANAVVTVRHNGVVIHENFELKKETAGGKKETDTPGPIHLQDHGDPVYYRNIWVVEKK